MDLLQTLVKLAIQPAQPALTILIPVAPPAQILCFYRMTDLVFLPV